ncbi:MAG: porin [Gemmatimonadales bacterium]
MKGNRPAVHLVRARRTLTLLAILFCTPIQVDSALAQGSDEATQPPDTVEQAEPSIRVGHGSRGFELGTSDGNYLLQLQFRVQLRYAYPFDSDPLTFDDFSEQEQNLFKVNRSRIKVGGNAYQPWLKYYMEYELGGNALLDFRVMVEKWPALKLKVGQWKAQYSRERIISSGRQQMMERSIINREFTIDRQQGVSLYGRLKGSGVADFNYWASVFTGMGRGARENDDTHLMWMFRGQWNFLGREVPFSGSDWEYHEKAAGVLAFAAVTNQSPYTRFSTSGGGQLIGFDDGEPGQYRVNQWLQETAFKYRGFAWQQAFHWKEVDDKVNQTIRTLTGVYFQAGYFFHHLWPAVPRPLELAARVAYYNPDVDQGSDLLREYVFAVNWFFNGHLNKLTSDLTFFNHDFPELGEQEKWRFRIQWDFST